MTDGPLSRIEWVEGELRSAILDGDLAPGDRLLTAQLSERFSVSPTPLREALHRFAGEGLVEFIPQKGARVTRLSMTDSGELCELRKLLEPLTVAKAAVSGEADWWSQVESASTRLLETWSASDFDARRAEQAYRKFFAVLTEPCPSVRLRRFATAIRDQHARYRLATIEQLDLAELESEHRQLLSAVKVTDSEAIEVLIGADVDRVAFAYLDLSAETGDAE